MVDGAQMCANQGMMDTNTDGTWSKAEAVEVLSEETTPPGLYG